MTPEQRQQWQTIASESADAIRPLAARIANHPRADFELLWLLVDFAQLIVHYAALLLLAQGRSDPEFSKLLERSGATEALAGKPSFGQWVGFVCSVARLLRDHGKTITTAPELSALSGAEGTPLSTALSVRNRLAHGSTGRFAVLPGETAELSGVVLELAQSLSNLCRVPLVPTTGGIAFSAPGSNAIPARPFAIPGDSEEPLLYAFIEKKLATFHGDSTQREDASAAVEIRKFFAALRDAEGGPKPRAASLTAADFSARSKAAVGKWIGVLRAERLELEKGFQHLAPFAGRAKFGAALTVLFREHELPSVIHLHAARGAGKRRFLADFIPQIVAEGTVVFPLACSKLDELPLATLLVESLGIDASFSTLPWTTKDFDRLLVLVDWEPLLAAPARAQELAELLAIIRTAPRTRILLVSDRAEFPAELGAHASFPFPPLPPEGARECYEQYSAGTGFLPTAEWDDLSDDTRAIFRHPLDVATFCEFYSGDVPDPALTALDFRDALWKSHILGNPAHRALVTALASHFIASGQRSIPRAMLAHIAEADRSTDNLWLLGILDETPVPAPGGWEIRIAFREFHWLVAALNATPLLAANSVARRTDALFAACSRFHPTCDALATRLADESAEENEIVFAAALRHRPKWIGKLTQAMLEKSYSHADGDLLLRLFAQAGQTEDAAVLEGCAAALGTIIANSHSPEARTEAARLLDELHQTSKAAGHELLAAVLAHEALAHFGPKPGSFPADELTAIIAVAVRHCHRTLRHCAENLFCKLPSAPEPKRARLASLADAADAQDRPEPLLATLLALIPLCEPCEAVRRAKQAVELTMQSGTWRSMAFAFAALAEAHRQSGKPYLAESFASAALALVGVGGDEPLRIAFTVQDAAQRIQTGDVKQSRRALFALRALRKANPALASDESILSLLRRAAGQCAGASPDSRKNSSPKPM